MTYSPNVPNANQSPGRLPTQGNTNWTRLEAIIDADHNFTDSTDTTEGYHKIVHWVKQSPAPSADANSAQSYALDADYKRSGSDITAPHIFMKTTSGEDTNEFPISVAPIRAFVNFNGTGVVGNQIIRSSYNITTVAKTATGRYTLTFPAMPSDGFAPMIVGMPSTNVEIMPFVVGGSYGSSVTTTTLKIAFVDAGGISGYRDVVLGSVVIVGG